MNQPLAAIPAPLRRRRLLAAAALGMLGPALAFPGRGAAASEGPLFFGVLPLGGPLQSRMDWQSVMDGLGHICQRPMVAVSVTSYDSMEQAIRGGRVDIAFLSGRLALEATTEYDMTVMAQVTRHDGLPGYRSVLLVRANGPIRDLEDVLGQPNRWRIARGERQSVSGYVVPQLELFLPRHIKLESHFTQEQIDTHEANYLALANGEVDVCTGNTADIERFSTHFPVEFSRLRIIWQSELIPHGVIMIRRSLAASMLEPGRAFLAGYGKGDTPEAGSQRAVLQRLHNLAGFLPADNRSLLPIVQIEYHLARESALNGQWVSEQARQARLQRIEEQRQARLGILNHPL